MGSQYPHYKRTVEATLDLYKKRLAWLNSASQAFFGVLEEDSVALVFDCDTPWVHKLKVRTL